MVRTSRQNSITQANSSQEKSKPKKQKIQDGGHSGDTQPNNSADHLPPLGIPDQNMFGALASSEVDVEVDVEKGPNCITCQNHVSEDDNAICCSKCERWVHQSCSTFNATEYKMLNRKNKINLMWFCDACIPLINCLLRNAPLSPHPRSETEGEMNKKLDKVIDGFAKLEKAMVNKETAIEEIIEEKVEKYFREKSEREERESNLVFHNLPESSSEDIVDRKSHDIEQVQQILDDLDVDPTYISEPARLGKKIETPDGQSKPRLLRVKLGSVSTKKQVLNRAKSLRKSTNQTWTKVYITPDLTYKERVENRKLRMELAARRENGESDLVIRNGKIVKVNQSFRGGTTEGPEPHQDAAKAAVQT